MISRDGHCPSYQGAYCLERETHQIATGMQRAIPHWRLPLEGGQGRQGTSSQKQGLGRYPVWDGSVAAGPGEPLRTQNWVPRRWGGGEAASLTLERAWKRVMHSHAACPTEPSCRLRVATSLSLGSGWPRAWAWGGCGGGGRSGSAMWVGKGASGEAEKKLRRSWLLERRHLSREAQGWGVGGAHAEEQSL